MNFKTTPTNTYTVTFINAEEVQQLPDAGGAQSTHRTQPTPAPLAEGLAPIVLNLATTGPLDELGLTKPGRKNLDFVLTHPESWPEDLRKHLQQTGASDPDQVFNAIVGWVKDTGARSIHDELGLNPLQRQELKSLAENPARWPQEVHATLLAQPMGGLDKAEIERALAGWITQREAPALTKDERELLAEFQRRAQKQGEGASWELAAYSTATPAEVHTAVSLILKSNPQHAWSNIAMATAGDGMKVQSDGRFWAIAGLKAFQQMFKAGTKDDLDMIDRTMVIFPAEERPLASVPPRQLGPGGLFAQTMSMNWHNGDILLQVAQGKYPNDGEAPPYLKLQPSELPQYPYLLEGDNLRGIFQLLQNATDNVRFAKEAKAENLEFYPIAKPAILAEGFASKRVGEKEQRENRQLIQDAYAALAQLTPEARDVLMDKELRSLTKNVPLNVLHRDGSLSESVNLGLRMCADVAQPWRIDVGEPSSWLKEWPSDCGVTELNQPAVLKAVLADFVARVKAAAEV